MTSNNGWKTVSVAMLLTSTSVCPAAENPFGLYVGGALGRATIRNDDILLGGSFINLAPTPDLLSVGAIWFF